MKWKDRVPKHFYNGDESPRVYNVGQLKEALKELPDDLEIGGNNTQLIVYNINAMPFLELNEDEDDY